MRSFLWDYYKQQGEKATCNHCQKLVSCVGGTSSGLKKHLRTHPKVLEQYLLRQGERDKELRGVKRPAGLDEENQRLFGMLYISSSSFALEKNFIIMKRNLHFVIGFRKKIL